MSECATCFFWFGTQDENRFLLQDYSEIKSTHRGEEGNSSHDVSVFVALWVHS